MPGTFLPQSCELRLPHLYVCPVISFLTTTQSTSHLVNSPELSWPICTVVSLPRFWHCGEMLTVSWDASGLPALRNYTGDLTFRAWGRG